MIKEISYAAYIIPVRIIDGKKQIALLEYAPGAYGPIGGRFDEGETNAIVALRREIIEELGQDAIFMVDSAKKISVSYKFKVAEHKIEKRGAYNEEHFFFVAKIPSDTLFEFCEQREENIKLVWLDSESLIDSNIIQFQDQREYFKAYLMPIVNEI